jgi:hypothetical protein
MKRFLTANAAHSIKLSEYLLKIQVGNEIQKAAFKCLFQKNTCIDTTTLRDPTIPTWFRLLNSKVKTLYLECKKVAKQMDFCRAI